MMKNFIPIIPVRHIKYSIVSLSFRKGLSLPARQVGVRSTGKNYFICLIGILFFCVVLFSCTTVNKKEEDKSIPKDSTIQDVPYTVKTKEDTAAPVRNGVFEERYENGIIKVRGNYAGGKRHGSWVSFFSNGKTWSEGLYVNGIREGAATVWYENGQKYYEGKYAKGKETGLWKFWDEKGTLIKEVDYDKQK